MKIKHFFSENKWKYRIKGNHVRVRQNGTLVVGSDCHLSNCRIFVEGGSVLSLGNNVLMDKCDVYIKGDVSIGNNCILNGGTYTVEDGTLSIGHHTKISAKRIWVRFGGVVSIGDYTNINNGSEIRCDEKVDIGNYNQVSYNVRIWDTNTHNIYAVEERREITEKYWPYFGKEIEQPETKPVRIGNDCWIGENATILKGTTLYDAVVVGYGTLITGSVIDIGKTVVNEHNLKII